MDIDISVVEINIDDIDSFMPIADAWKRISGRSYIKLSAEEKRNRQIEKNR